MTPPAHQSSSSSSSPSSSPTSLTVLWGGLWGGLCAGLLAIALLGVAAVGCVVEPIDLNDRKCDDEHPCVEGYTCIKETCELEDDDDSGSASSD